MRLFVIWPEKSIEIVNMMQELKNYGHEIIYWVGYDDSESHRLSGTTFHAYEDAMLGIPAKGVDLSGFSPPSQEIIDKLYGVESLFLTMLNRIVGEKGVSERKRLYYKLLSYWLGVLKKYQPQAIIFPMIPHFGYDYLIFELANILNIETLMFLDTRIPGRVLFMNDFWKGSKSLREVLENNAGRNFQLSDLAEDIRSYYLKISDQDSSQLPPHIRYQKRKYSFWYRIFHSLKLTESIKDLSIFRRGWGFLSRTVFKNGFWGGLWQSAVIALGDNSKKEYEKFQKLADFSKRFAYVPLNVQPECSTSPQGGIFVDQILMLKTLSVALPKDWIIYAKEHPIQWLRFGDGFSPYKYPGYYEAISKIKNVVLVPMETSSSRLIKESQAVAVISGAAGWEAVLRSKPAIVFGYPWYKDCPEIFRVNDLESCRKAIEEIVNGHKVDQQKIINFLKSLELATIRAFIARNAGEDSGLSFEESMKNITEKLLKALEISLPGQGH